MAELTNVPGITFDSQPDAAVPQQALTLEPERPAISAAATYDKAEKWDFGLGPDESPGVSALANNIETGKQSLDQQIAASRENMRRTKLRMETIQDIAKNPDKYGPNAANLVYQMAQEDFTDPNTIMEKLYARRLINTTAGASQDEDGNNVFNDAYVQDPFWTSVTTDAFEEVAMKQETARSILEELKAEQVKRRESMGYFGDAVELGASFIPLYSTLAQTNLVKEAPTSAYLMGNNKQEQYTFLWNQNPQRFNEILRRVAFEPNNTRDLTQLINFMEGVVGYSTNDSFLDNLVTGADAAFVAAPVATKLSTVLKDTIKANVFSRMSVPLQQEAAGNVAASAYTRAMDNFTKRAANSGRSLDEIAGNAPGIFDIPGKMKGAVQAMGAEGAAKLEAEMLAQSANLIDVFNSTKITRLDRGSDALKIAMDEAVARVKKVYSNTNDLVNDVSLVSKDDTFNVDFAKLEIGKRVGKNAPEVAVRKTKPEGEAALSTGQQKKIDTAQKKFDTAVAKRDAIADKKSPEYKAADKITKAAQAGLNKAKNPGSSTISAKTTLGKTSLQPYDSYAAAERAAIEDIGFPKGTFSVEPKGSGYFISYLTPLDEVQASVRDQLVKSTQATTPRVVGGFFSNLVRTPDELLAENIVKEGKSIYAQSAAVGAMKENLEPLSLLSRAERKDWDEFTRWQQNYTDPLTGQRGKFSQSVGEFSADFRNRFGKAPTDKQIRAYFAYTRQSDFNSAAYNIGMWTAKNRVALKNIELGVMTDAGRIPIDVEGKVVDRLPWHAKKEWDKGILFFDGENPSRMVSSKPGRNGAPPVYENYKRLQYVTPAEIEARIKNGKYSIVQLTEYGQKALMEHPWLGKNIPGQVDYLLVRNPKVKNLSLRQVPYRPGGHVEYAHLWYLRQGNVVASKLAGETPEAPQVSINTWYGDTNIRGFNTEKQGRMFEARYQEAQRLLKEAMTLRKTKGGAGQAALKEIELKNYLSKNLPESYDEFKAMFVPDKKTGKPALLDINQPVHLTPKDTSTYKAGKYNHMENLRSIHDAPDNIYNQNIDLSFGMERNDQLHVVTQEGSVNNPAYKLRPAPLVSPADMIDRSAGRIMRSMYVQDLKTKMAEQFIQEFHHVLDGNLQAFRDNPVRTLIDPPFKNGVTGADVNAARKMSLQAKEWFHIKDTWERQVDDFRKTMLEKILDIKPETGRWIEPWLLHRAKTPDDFLKSFAFHMNILSPHQLVLQSMSMVNIAAIEGIVPAGNGVATSWFHHAMRKAGTDEVRKAIAQRASTFGIKPEHFLESDEALKNSGFWRVGQEVNWDVNMGDAPSLVHGTWGRIKDAGRWFFDQGERTARYASWATAYNKWRAANPTARLTDEAVTEIRNRADLYMGNMSSASNAVWQNNAFTKVPTQFWAYPIRLGEQFYGKRLNKAEKFRMLATYGAMFGFPSSFGLIAPITPAHEAIRQYQLSNPNGIFGSPMPEGTIAKVLNEGILGYLGNSVIGDNQNFGEKFGTGMSFLDDIIDGDKTVLQAYLGASGTVWSNVWSASEPFAQALLGVFSGDHYPLKAPDFWEAARTQSGVNKFAILSAACTSGEYFSRKGDPQGEVSCAEGLASFAFGTMPQRMTDAYSILKDQKALVKFQFQKKQDIVQNLRRGFSSDNPVDAAEFFKRARADRELARLNPMDYADTLREALKPAEMRDAAHQLAYKMRNMTPEQQTIVRRIIGQGPQ